MTKEEFVKIADAIKTYYPSEKILPNKQAMQLWYWELEDLPYETAVISLRMHVSTNRFPPTIADLRKGAAQMSGESRDWSDGWAQFREAVRRFGYYRQEEALASMDDITRRVVSRLGWKDLCTSENIMTDRANFRMVYEQEKVKADERAVLPERMRQALDTKQRRLT